MSNLKIIYIFSGFYIMQKIALISFTLCIYPNLWWCIAVSYKNTKKVYFIKVARASLSSVWRRLFSLIIVHVLDMIHTYIYVLEHVQLKQPDQGHHTLFISNGRCLQIAARANVFWLFFFHPLHRCTTDLWVFFIKLARLYWYIYSHAVLIN